MSTLDIIFSIFGGLGLFLLGIKLMEDGMHQFAGEYLKRIMSILTKNRWASLLAGVILTTITQSSSATTSMVVGFVNAGFTTVANTLGFMLGANIGTTTTGQLMSFKLDIYALLILGIGVVLYLFHSRHEKIRNAGLSFTGLGMLLFGMVVMKQSIIPIQQSGIIEQWFLYCNSATLTSMLIGLAVGIVGAALIHSGAAVGILITLAATGAIKNIEDVVPIIAGCEIGTCTAVVLASLRTTRTAKKAALAHVLFNTIGSLFVLVTMSTWVYVVRWIDTDIIRQIANLHTLSSLIKCALFLPILPLANRALNWILPDKIETTVDLIAKYKTFARSENLNKESLDTPSLALLQTHKEIGVMILVIMKMITCIQQALLQGQDDKILKVKHYEEIVDNIKHDIRDYMTLLSRHQVSAKQSIEIAAILEGASELERVGDHVESMIKYVNLAKEKTMVLDDNNRSRIEAIMARCIELAVTIQECVGNSAQDVSKVTLLIKQLEKDIKTARDYYMGCLKSGSWNVLSDMSFSEFITIMEKFVRHCRSFTGKYLKQLHEIEMKRHRLVKKEEISQQSRGERK